MATNVNVLSGGDELTQKLKSLRSAQRLQYAEQLNDQRLTEQAAAASQRVDHLASFSVQPKVASSFSFRPAAHRFPKTGHKAFQLVCRQGTGAQTYADWISPHWALSSGVHEATQFSVLIADPIGKEPVEVMLPELSYRLPLHYQYKPSSNFESLLEYAPLSFDGETIYFLEVYFLKTRVPAPSSPLAEGAWAYLRTLNLNTKATSGLTFFMGYKHYSNPADSGTYQSADYPTVKDLLDANAPKAPLYSQFAWTRPSIISFPPVLKPDFNGTVWTNTIEDMRTAAMYRQDLDAFYDFVPIHTGRFSNSFYLGRALEQVLGTQERSETFPFEGNRDWDAQVDYVDMKVAADRLWEPWQLPNLNYNLTISGFGKYLSGQVPLPTSGAFCNSVFHDWLSSSGRRYAYPLIQCKVTP